ncbi:GNAT family N-acetyltransferase [Leifsonia sp. F6_8S_P_1B]|uniref:GNAT family N-acetyltransferase n=1 Tax=Leifsonia williamsii TaxID=3035919 RepID=A0ABT8K921_9MICO|nr:GNAT family N-acetyltransferase [Leifsonia williamsii]MDN4613306.1 GNAT family N-acetyltransferase [Leifsonia williamsii]
MRGDGEHESGWAWFRTGAPHEELNGVLQIPSDRVDEAQRAIGDIPALWHSWPGDPVYDIEAALVERGFRFVEEEPLMAMPLSHPAEGMTPMDSATAEAAPYRIREVDHAGPDDLADWVRVWVGTTLPDETVNTIRVGLLRAGDAARYLLAEVDGIPVGCAAAIAAGGAVSVEHVVTSADHRGRGIGTALTAAATEAGRRLGATVAVLTASPDGVGIYRRLGFTEHGRVRRFAA